MYKRQVEQRLVGGKARHHLVNGLDEVDDVEHGAVGHGGRDVPGDGVGQRGAHVALRQLLGPGALAVENVAVALHEDVAGAQHVGQLAHLLRVGDGLVEGLVEVVRAQDGHVGVGGFFLLVGVPVDHCQVVVVIFLAHKAAGILAEGAHLVFEGAGICLLYTSS